MTGPVVAQKAPYLIEVVSGKTYYWCTCGKSQSQPFCDGSHKDTVFRPSAYTPEQSGKVAFCGCKATKGQPLCDGSHKEL